MSQSSSPSQTQTQVGAWNLPYQQYGLQQATAQYQNVDSPQQLVAGFSPQQNQAITGMTNLATNNPTLGAAQNYTQNVLSGNPANNPYLNSEFQQGANQVQNQLDSTFAGAGRNIIGSAPVQSDSLNNLATQLYGGAYNTGVQEQEQAAANAPNVTNAQAGLQSDLFNTGQQVQNLAQNYIQAPQQYLSNYLNQVYQAPGTTTTTTNPLSAMQQLGLSGIGAYLGTGLGSTLGSSVGSLLGSSSSTGSNVGSLLGALGGSFL